jgi:membrane peptidoglycan carboxypeptidase
VKKFLERLAASRYWTGDGLPHWRAFWKLRVAALIVLGLWAFSSMVMGAEIYRATYGRRDLPDLGPFIRFEFPSVGRVNDRTGALLMGLARERREITHYADIPPIVRGAILATEDKRFYNHEGIDLYSVPRAMWKARLRPGHIRFPQGGSTITQQLVRGAFLQDMTAKEHSNELQYHGVFPHVLSWFVGPRNVNRILRKREEVRLALWLERKMQKEFGSRERAKEEILARYASLIYMGNGQYGFARASEYYFGQPLSTFTAADADKAALLASIAKAPRDYAPDSSNAAAVLRRRNQTLGLMADAGVIAPAQLPALTARPLPVATRDTAGVPSSAVVAHALDEMKNQFPEYGLEELLRGSVQVNSTVDAKVQQFANEALQHGLELYEKRHPKAKGVIQGAVVVLSNGDGAILGEVGGRQAYQGKPSTYKDYNRVTDASRQPGSAMKPIVYLAAFRNGDFTLDTPVPDDPISVPDNPGVYKAIANYDGQYKGIIPLREALAESRNAVAIWVTEQIGLDSVIRTARSLGVHTPLKPYPTTALGASEVNLLELANAYRAIASGVSVEPHLIRSLELRSGEVVPARAPVRLPPVPDPSLELIQEGLRGVVRIPGGTANALSSRAFGIPVMGKTGTTNDFKDALFIGSTYGEGGITVAVRIGFDDNHTLGRQESGGRVALPVFQELVAKIYKAKLFGNPPPFPSLIEQHINQYLESLAAIAAVTNVQSGTGDIR